MSLINQMLQDLEKRRASAAERGTLPNQVRVLPRAEKTVALWWLAGIGVALVLTALFAWQLNEQPAPLPPVPVARVAPQESPSAAVATPAPAPAAMLSGPASRLALELQAALPAATMLVSASGSVPQAATTPNEPLPSASAEAPPPALASRLALELETAPPTAARPVAPPGAGSKPAPISREPPPKPSKAVEKTPSAVTTASVITAVPAARPAESSAKTKTQVRPASPQIDKRSHQLTSQQLAENEYRNAANLLNQGRLPEAQQGFRLALQHDSGHAGARQGLFGLLLEAKKNGEAEQLLQDGLRLNPQQTGFAMALARMQVDRGDTAGAIDTMQKSAPGASGSPDYLAFLAALLQRQSRHREAVEHYQAALRLAPGSGVWLMGLGISLQALNRNSEAQDAFRRAKATQTLNTELQAFVDQRLRQLQ